MLRLAPDSAPWTVAVTAPPPALNGWRSSCPSISSDCLPAQCTKYPCFISASFLYCSPRRPYRIPGPLFQHAPLHARPRRCHIPSGSRTPPISSQGTARPTRSFNFSTHPHSTLPSLLHLPIRPNLHRTWGHQHVHACVCVCVRVCLPHFIPYAPTQTKHTHGMNGDKCHLHFRTGEVKDGTARCRPGHA